MRTDDEALIPSCRGEDTYKYAKLIISLVAKTDRHDTEIKELQTENKRLSALIQQLIFDRQRDQDRAESQRIIADKDRELLLLRLDAKLVQYERRLPPPTPGLLDDE
jgi:hypothetical protein